MGFFAIHPIILTIYMSLNGDRTEDVAVVMLMIIAFFNSIETRNLKNTTSQHIDTKQMALRFIVYSALSPIF